MCAARRDARGPRRRARRPSMRPAPAPLHRAGAGSPLLLLHGFTGTWRIWRPLLGDARRPSRCPRPDAGRSPRRARGPARSRSARSSAARCWRAPCGGPITRAVRFPTLARATCATAASGSRGASSEVSGGGWSQPVRFWNAVSQPPSDLRDRRTGQPPPGDGSPVHVQSEWGRVGSHGASHVGQRGAGQGATPGVGAWGRGAWMRGGASHVPQPGAGRRAGPGRAGAALPGAGRSRPSRRSVTASNAGRAHQHEARSAFGRRRRSSPPGRRPVRARRRRVSRRCPPDGPEARPRQATGRQV